MEVELGRLEAPWLKGRGGKEGPTPGACGLWLQLSLPRGGPSVLWGHLAPAPGAGIGGEALGSICKGLSSKWVTDS